MNKSATFCYPFKQTQTNSNKMPKAVLHLSTSIHLNSDKTNYVFAHDPENPQRIKVFEQLKNRKGAHYGLNGNTETGEPFNCLIRLKQCSNEKWVETHFGGVEIYAILKFNDHDELLTNRFQLALSCISLNEHSKIDWIVRSNFKDNHKHQDKTIKFISICGTNAEFFSEVQTHLEKLGYQKLSYPDGYLFYWYDKSTFNNFSIKQQLSFLFTIHFSFGEIEIE